MSPSNDTFVVFAPGGWSGSSSYDSFRNLLSQRGIPSIAADHPSNGAEPPNKALSDDAKNLRQILTNLAEQGKKIVLVGHSYGGMVISGAAAGLGIEERSKTGKSGGVILLVFMAAFVAPKGKTLEDMIGGQPYPWMVIQDNYVRIDPTVDLLPDVPQHVKEAKRMDSPAHICLPAFLESATEEPWHTIPSAYIACDDDIAIPPSLQDSMIQSLSNPRVFHLKSGHSPHLSMPNETANILEELCK